MSRITTDDIAQLLWDHQRWHQNGWFIVPWSLVSKLPSSELKYCCCNKTGKAKRTSKTFSCSKKINKKTALNQRLLYLLGIKHFWLHPRSEKTLAYFGFILLRSDLQGFFEALIFHLWTTFLLVTGSFLETKLQLSLYIYQNLISPTTMFLKRFTKRNLADLQYSHVQTITFSHQKAQIPWFPACQLGFKRPTRAPKCVTKRYRGSSATCDSKTETFLSAANFPYKIQYFQV